MNMGMASAMPTSMNGSIDSSKIDSTMQWNLEPGWTAERSSGIRLATFKAPQSEALITLTYLPGMAGELSANLRRWMKQAKIELATDEFQQFMQSSETLQNSSGEKFQVYDFTQSPSPAGFIVIMYTRPKGNYFVKLTADINSAKQLKPSLINLALSLKERS